MQSSLSILFLVLADTTAGYLVPNPPGKYNVTFTTGPLIDYTRNDPYAATPTPRALMLSVFQPATCASTEPVPYMPNKTAYYQGPYLETHFNITANLTPLFLEARLPVCSNHSSTCSPLDDGPILLFSPALGIPRFYYNVLASAIASEGFTVITIDHPEDANIIVYPDGHAVYYNTTVGTIKDSPTLDEYPRAADASFIIDQLSNATAMAQLLPQRGARPFPTDRVGMLGHSLGGAASIVAASRDTRLRAAIVWDGTIFGTLPVMSQPVLFMSREHYYFPDWKAAWPQLHGPKLWVSVTNATHETFADVPTLLQAGGQDSAPFAQLLGTIAPAEMVRTLTAYTTAWMNGAFAGKEGGPLLDGQEHGKYPAVSTVMKGNF